MDMQEQWRVRYIGKGRLDGAYNKLLFTGGTSHATHREQVERFVAADPVQFQIVPPNNYDGQDIEAHGGTYRIRTTSPALVGLVKHLPVHVSRALVEHLVARALDREEDKTQVMFAAQFVDEPKAHAAPVDPPQVVDPPAPAPVDPPQVVDQAHVQDPELVKPVLRPRTRKDKAQGAS